MQMQSHHSQLPGKARSTCGPPTQPPTQAREDLSPTPAGGKTTGQAGKVPGCSRGSRDRPWEQASAACITAGAAPRQQVRPDKDTQARQHRIPARSIPARHPRLSTAQTAWGPRCGQALPRGICNSPHLFPLERGKRSSRGSSAPARQLLLFPCEHPSQAASALGAARGRVCAQGTTAPAGAASPAEQQEFLRLWYHMRETPEEERGWAKGSREAPKPQHHDKTFSSTPRDPSRFRLPVPQPPLRLVTKKPAQLWKRPFNF